MVFFSRVFHGLRSKLFRPVEVVHRLKDRENKKAEKNEKERSKEKKNRNGSAKKRKKEVQILAYAHAPSKMLYIFTWNFQKKTDCSVRKSAFLAKFREI